MQLRKSDQWPTVDDLDIVIGWLRSLPLDATLTGGGSSSNEGKRGVSGGVNNLKASITPSNPSSSILAKNLTQTIKCNIIL